MRMPGDLTDATTRRRVPSFPAAARVLSVLALTGSGALVGCQAGGSTSDSSEMANGSATETTTSEERRELLNEIENRYVVGPIAASRVNYRVDWQHNTGSSGINSLNVADDSVLVLSTGNFLTRLGREDGQSYWNLPVAQVADEVYSVTYVPEASRVHVMTGAELHELDSATGAIQGKHRLQQIANTDCVQYGDSLLYGSRNGQLVWFSHTIAFQHSAYQIASSMTVRPAIHAGMVAAVGNEGELMLIGARNARRFWSRQLIEPVVAPAVVTNDAVYVAGQDQYVQAFDVSSGLRIWADLTEAPLEDSPVIIGDRLYQAVPGLGLVCYEALPFDTPGGIEHWVATDVAGTVVTTRGNRLYVWDDETRVMTILDAARGDVIDSYNWSKAESLHSTSLDRGELFLTDAEGNVLRLVPSA